MLLALHSFLFRKQLVWVVLILLLLGASASNLKAQVLLTRSNLPIFVIQSIDSIRIDDKVMATMEVFWQPGQDTNYLTDVPHYDDWIGIEYRGSSSAFFPKPQFNVETRFADGDNQNFPLLGFSEENDWILYGPYSDKSLLRNVLAYWIYGQMDHYAVRTKFCEVIVDGEYQGLYVFTEKIKVDEGRVDLAKLESEDISGDQVTGGYVFKLDKLSGSLQEGWESSYPSLGNPDKKVFYQFHHPKPSSLEVEQKDYLQEYMRNFEDRLLGPEGLTLEGIDGLIESSSFIDNLLLFELGKNIDGYRLSTFFYKDKDSKDPRLYMGPAWDYNLAFGNANYYYGDRPVGWQIDFPFPDDSFQLPLWWRTLLSNAGFRERIVDRWWELRAEQLHLDTLFGQIDTWVLETKAAQERNFQQWEILGSYVWPNVFIGDTYTAEVDYLKSWVADRIDYMDAELENLNRNLDGVSTDASIFGNPMLDNGILQFGLDAVQEVSAQLYDSNGRLVRRILEKNHLAYGNHSLSLELNGLAPGLYLIELKTAKQRYVRKLILH